MADWVFRDIVSKHCPVENKLGCSFEDTVHLLLFFRNQKRSPGWNRLGMYSCGDHWHIGHVNKRIARVSGTRMMFIQPRNEQQIRVKKATELDSIACPL